jgi:hypothetical protein
VPIDMNEIVNEDDPRKLERAMRAVLGMGKIDVGEVRRAVNEG